MSCNLSYDEYGNLIVAYCQGMMTLPKGLGKIRKRSGNMANKTKKSDSEKKGKL